MEYTRVALPMGGVPDGSVNAYLLGREPTVLVDPGVQTQDLDEAVAERAVDAILATHTHPDHVGALAHYAKTTGATVYARRWRERQFERTTGVTPDHSLAEGDTIDLGADGTIKVMETPGHAIDHLAFQTPAGTVCGDLAIATGSLAVTVPGGDMRAYLTSLRRLYARNPPRLLPGHGPVAEDAQGTIRRLIDHRRRRERRVRRAVAGGACDLDSVVDAAYEKDLTGVRRLAEGTVRAHLQKLAVEGELVWDRRDDVVRGNDELPAGER